MKSEREALSKGYNFGWRNTERFRHFVRGILIRRHHHFVRETRLLLAKEVAISSGNLSSLLIKMLDKSFLYAGENERIAKVTFLSPRQLSGKIDLLLNPCSMHEF